MSSWKRDARKSVAGVETSGFGPDVQKKLTERTRTRFCRIANAAMSRKGFFRHNCGGISE